MIHIDSLNYLKLGYGVFAKYEIECAEPLRKYKGETIAFEEAEKCRRKYLRQKIPSCFIFEFHFAGNMLWYVFVHIYLNHD